jgi:hypothetical protein
MVSTPFLRLFFEASVRAGEPSGTNQKATPRRRVAIWLDGDGGMDGGGVLGGRQWLGKRAGVRPPIGQRTDADAGTRQDRAHQMRPPKPMERNKQGESMAKKIRQMAFLTAGLLLTNAPEAGAASALLTDDTFISSHISQRYIINFNTAGNIFVDNRPGRSCRGFLRFDLRPALPPDATAECN